MTVSETRRSTVFKVLCLSLTFGSDDGEESVSCSVKTATQVLTFLDDYHCMGATMTLSVQVCDDQVIPFLKQIEAIEHPSNIADEPEYQA